MIRNTWSNQEDKLVRQAIDAETGSINWNQILNKTLQAGMNKSLKQIKNRLVNKMEHETVTEHKQREIHQS